MTIGGAQSSHLLLACSTSVPLQLTSMVTWDCSGYEAGAEHLRQDLRAARTRYADMTGQSTQKAAKQRKPKARKFYIIDCGYSAKRINWEVENLDVLLAGAAVLYPPEGKRGFPAYRETPRLVIGKRSNASPPKDIEPFHSYWLISDRLKVLFESIDPQAFAYQACDVELRDGSIGPVYWLCDVVRVLDAFVPGTVEDMRTYRERTGKIYRGFRNDTTLVFNEDLIGDSHVFRTPYSFMDVFCDQILKEACKQAGIKGIRFLRK
jgi:hypothetical protein